MIVVLIELITSFFQYLSILVTTHDVSFPESWKSPFNFLSAFNLHFDFLAGYFPGLSDIRLYFTVISVVFPLLFVIFGLIFLNRKLVVASYIIFLSGVMCFLAGAFARVIVSVTEIPLSARLAEMMMYVGAGVTLLCLIVYTIVRCCWEEKEFQGKKKTLEEETENLNKLATIQRFVLCLLFLAFFFTGGFYLAPAAGNTTLEIFWLGFTWACLGFATICLIWGLVGLCVAGRKVQWTVGQWAEVAFLRVLLIAMSLLYIPIGSGVFLVFNCNDFSCGDGYRLPDPGSSVWRTSTNGVEDTCQACTPAALTTQQCPSSLHGTLCTKTTQTRLEYDITTNCVAMQTFFWPAAALIIIMFVLGAPVLFQQMISRGSVLLLEEFPLMYDLKKKHLEEKANEGGEHADGGTTLDEEPPTEEERWDLTLAQSDNVAKFLYQPFTRRYRYVRLIQLLQKLIIVAATVYVWRNKSFSPAYIAIGVSILVHIVATIALIYHKPFIMSFESKIAILMSTALSVACLLGLLLLSGIVVPDWLMLIVLILNGVLPILALIIGIILEYSRGKQADEEEEKRRKDQMVQEVVEKEVAEDQAVMAVYMAHGAGGKEKRKQEEEDAKLADQLHQEEVYHNHTQHARAPSPAPQPMLLETGVSPHFVAEENQPSPHMRNPGKSPRASPLPSPSPSQPPLPHAQVPVHHHATLDAGGHQPQHRRSPNSSPTPEAVHNRGGHRAQQSAHHQATAGGGDDAAPHHHPDGHDGHHKAQTKYITGEETILLPTKSQKVLRHEKLLEEAEKHVAEQIKADMDELHEMQEDVDLRIDYDIKKMLNRFLMGAGVLGFLALGLCILGLLINVDITDAGTRNQDHDFAGYLQFSNFTQHCCCIPFTNPLAADRQELEKWVCDNGRIVEKIRLFNSTAGAVTSGYSVRDLCSVSYKTGCAANSNYALSQDLATNKSKYGVTCAASSNVTYAELSYA